MSPLQTCFLFVKFLKIAVMSDHGAPWFFSKIWNTCISGKWHWCFNLMSTPVHQKMLNKRDALLTVFMCCKSFVQALNVCFVTADVWWGTDWHVSSKSAEVVSHTWALMKDPLCQTSSKSCCWELRDDSIEDERWWFM